MAALGRDALATAEPEISYGLLTVTVGRAEWIPGLLWARDELGCAFFDWLSAVDELDDGFGVVAHLLCPRGAHHHLLLRTLVPRDDPVLPTATTLYRGANWHEREAHEMFGIGFDGHPNLVPLLLPEGFSGHPLRKEFVLASRVVKPWPGAVNPGQSAGEAARRPGKRPPGVPGPGRWPG
jgi:NADH-quinone oxidoreductase subunit C